MNEADNDTAKAIAISNILLILAFIGLILGGFSISVDRSSHSKKVLSKNNVLSTLRADNADLISNTSTAFATIDSSNVVENNNQIVVDKISPSRRVAELDGKEKAMLGMLLVMLKQR